MLKIITSLCLVIAIATCMSHIIGHPINDTTSWLFTTWKGLMIWGVALFFNYTFEGKSKHG